MAVADVQSCATTVVTVKGKLLLVFGPTVTDTDPVVAPAGTVTVIDVFDQAVAVASVLLNCTVLAPCTVLNVVPVKTTVVPTAPLETERLFNTGATNGALTFTFVGGCGAWARSVTTQRRAKTAKHTKRRWRLIYCPVGTFAVMANTIVTSHPRSIPSDPAKW